MRVDRWITCPGTGAAFVRVAAPLAARVLSTLMVVLLTAGRLKARLHENSMASVLVLKLESTFQAAVEFEREWEACVAKRPPGYPRVAESPGALRAGLPLPSAWRRALEAHGARKRKTLNAARNLSGSDGGSGYNFATVGISMPLELQALSGLDGDATLLGLGHLMKRGEKCFVVVVGNVGDLALADAAAQLGCETHVFECLDTVDGKAWTYHDLCAARKVHVGTTLDSQAASVLHPISKFLRAERNKRISILSLNVRGLEWQFFRQELHKMSPGFVEEIRLSLYVEGAASALVVPAPSDAHPEDRHVSELFGRLHDEGYRVSTKDVSTKNAGLGRFTLLWVGAGREALALPPAINAAFQAYAMRSVTSWRGSLGDLLQPGHNVFEAVNIALPLAPPILDHSPKSRSGEGDKNLVGSQQLKHSGNRCVVYGMGISSDSAFEEQMAMLGCETHAFDCTIDPRAKSVTGKHFVFHQWCIGVKPKASMKNEGYASVYLPEDESRLEFKGLLEVMALLGHTFIDVLKFDIEGFEWQLFELLFQANVPVGQMSFELHSRWSNRKYVPHAVVACKDNVEVNRLFAALYDRGHYVVSKELNGGDSGSAEFVTLNMNASVEFHRLI
eukprot:CAMPEP_0117535104 /NCGR_PEP_ID=MMETSP0784-20121206/40761_1 /TAXON_ID=39447 /ORGANISM="" /LENGTH=617 /DNA_ID=CAMNT_0005331617 /DNA_START=217 /DNA_END=2071 /DNA_ORIENTATION=+